VEARRAPGRPFGTVAVGFALVGLLIGTAAAPSHAPATVALRTSRSAGLTTDPGQRPNVLLLIWDDQPSTIIGRLKKRMRREALRGAARSSRWVSVGHPRNLT
jgi:hypothetical protein